MHFNGYAEGSEVKAVHIREKIEGDFIEGAEYVVSLINVEWGAFSKLIICDYAKKKLI